MSNSSQAARLINRMQTDASGISPQEKPRPLTIALKNGQRFTVFLKVLLHYSESVS
ncbi:hypothetical protein H6F67_17275 [Microcoleus sp. FACHB-1515]|uniref:hypothetical protein n=1 Tax=Cyanophyceae TaxID=3028117 RepID=UPI0016835679|nr:hypothetical protein [Microcoleus sp. FACHB-1515]MBD2091597.1 hypothetical protein [Microcoleus sp. FACHB-1515]